ncbi:MAG: transposase, partial [Dehalococcoidales bacterium]|nr:transposase [Dehalococcoidales bacterium]
MAARISEGVKKQLIDRSRSGEKIVDLCREVGVSRTAFYRWVKKSRLLKTTPRKDVFGFRTPASHWRAVPADVQRLILKTCLVEPWLSPRQVAGKLRPELDRPLSAKGVWSVLKRNGLNTREKRAVYLEKYGNSLVRPLVPAEKMSLIRRFEAGEQVADLCREAGISRTTFYKWLDRYRRAETPSERVLEDQRPAGEDHWRAVPEAEKFVKGIVIESPELTLQEIVAQLPEEEGKPILGTHGVYNLLKRLDLNTIYKRKAFSALHQPVSLPLPVPEVGLPDFLRGIPVISSIPPPVFATLS